MANCPSCNDMLVEAQLGSLGAMASGGRIRAAGDAKPLANPKEGRYVVCMNEDCENYLVLDAQDLPTSSKCSKCGEPLHRAQIEVQKFDRKPEDIEAQDRAKKMVWQCQTCKSVFPPKVIGG